MLSLTPDPDRLIGFTESANDDKGGGGDQSGGSKSDGFGVFPPNQLWVWASVFCLWWLACLMMR